MHINNQQTCAQSMYHHTIRCAAPMSLYLGRLPARPHGNAAMIERGNMQHFTINFHFLRGQQAEGGRGGRVGVHV